MSAPAQHGEMRQVTASMPGDQDIGSYGSDDGWLTALAVHRGSFLPLHRQIHDLVRQEIDAGRLTPGSRLPSEGALAEQWGVSLAPVRQALMHLAAEGYLDRGRGRGTFVRQPKFEEKISTLSSFTGSHAEHGDRLELVMLYKGLVPRRPEAAALGGRSRKLVLIQRLARLEASPVALLSAYLDPARVPGIEHVRAESVIEAVHATDEEAAPLGVGTGAMVLRMDSVTYDRADEAVEFSKVLYLVERFRFSFESHRFDDRILHFPSPGVKGGVRKR